MNDLKDLENIIYERLQEIRNKEKKTLNDLEEYKELQEKARTIYKVKCWLMEVKQND